MEGSARAFSLCITEGLNEVEQSDLEEAIRQIPHVDTVIGCFRAAWIHSLANSAG